MEFMPWITRAQSMDVLSSQANRRLRRHRRGGGIRPGAAVMMTAAGTVPAAKVFVMGSASPACRPSQRRAGSAQW
jgi:NAD/NADP transhydrogenase alpha subunit